MIQDKLKISLAKAVSESADIDYQTVITSLERPKNRDFGDISFPCFRLAQAAKTSANDCAISLASKIKLPEGIEEALPTGPFLNFRYNKSLFASQAIGAVFASALPPLTKLNTAQTIVLEYSSPNIAKPFHVGHLRATLIGNCLDRIYRRLGFITISINHLGDWGTQFGFVWAGCEIWGRPNEPSVKTLVELYKKATTKKEEQEIQKKKQPNLSFEQDVNEMARRYFIDLEQGKKEAVDFWKWCSDISLHYLKDTYERLGVGFDHYTGESFYSDKMEAVLKELRDANLLVESQGAMGVDLGEAEGFARVMTPDGRSLYLTRDLATAKYRAETYNFDRAIYVVGAPQTLHFQQIKGILAKLGKSYADKIEHVAFGHVVGMKTRGDGEILELNDFLDEAYERSLFAYREQVTKRPVGLDEAVVAEAVGIAAIIFSNLSRSRLKDVHFSWQHALEFQGDSGPYLLYAYARINGIREKAKEAGIVPSTSINPNALTEEAAFQLALTLDDFGDALSRTVFENEPAHLAAYALELSKNFSKAYNELQVVGEDKEKATARLTLFEATRLVLGEAITLLGFKPLERM